MASRAQTTTQSQYGAPNIHNGVSSNVPHLFTTLPLVRDDMQTTTSVAQDKVAFECLPYLKGDVDGIMLNDSGVPCLLRQSHISFLRKCLGRLPGGFVMADASRPWMLYWALNGLATLGYDVSRYRQSLLQTVQSMQNESGGFGGGHGQSSHLATTYASILSIAIVGGEELYDFVDRRAMWKWLCALKQPNGSFAMAVGGEVDVRGAYCAAVIVSLLGLPLELTSEAAAAWPEEHPTLFTKLAEYVRRCQTYEGGISGQPDAEAHGAYAFCALGCLALLDAPDRVLPQYLDLPRLMSWLSSRQYAPEGGFSGRTNKLVDGCYSHWVGACWPLIEAGLGRKDGGRRKGRITEGGGSSTTSSKRNEAYEAPHDQSSLYSREGLLRYILCCCQDLTKRGGLRDKPGKPTDGYHSCYVLSGLSSAQHQWRPTHAPDISKASMSEKGLDTAATADTDTFWALDSSLNEEQIYDTQDQVLPLHPVYAIPNTAAANMKAYYASKPGF